MTVRQLRDVITWKCTSLAMLGSAMNIWCSRQQMRHCTSLRSLSRPPSALRPPWDPVSPTCLRMGKPGADWMHLNRLSPAPPPDSCSSSWGDAKHTSSRICTAALSWRRTKTTQTWQYVHLLLKILWSVRIFFFFFKDAYSVQQECVYLSKQSK